MSELGPIATARRFELVVVRHGRTAWNVAGRFQGHTDVPLDATGREQAHALAAALCGERFDFVVTSDLARAYETAEIVARDRATPPERDARWREMRFGSWEGLTWNEILAREPAMAGRSISDPGGYVPAGGEPFGAVCARVHDAVRVIENAAHSPARTLIVTHAGALHALLHVALGDAAAAQMRVRFSPASVTRLDLGPGGTRVLELNRTFERSPAGQGAERE